MARIDITEFERLIRNSKLGTEYKSSIIKDIINLINKNKGVGFGFINNEDFLKTVKVISNCKQQDSEIYTLLTSYVESYAKSYIQLKNNIRLINNSRLYKSYEIILHSPMPLHLQCWSIMSMVSCINNNQYEKLNFIPYALLASYDVISTYREQTIPDALLASHSVTNIYTKRIIPRALCIKRPNNKRSDVKMSDYLLDSQMIREDMSWLKKTDQKAFQKLHDQIKKMQDPEVKKTFDYYCNQINSHEKREALKYTAVALAIVCTASVGIAIKTKNTTAWLIAVVTGIIAVAICGYLLCSSRLECVELEKIKNPPQHSIDNPTCIFIK